MQVKYDGCSGGMSKAWRFLFNNQCPPWEGCCDSHDQLYAKGGTSIQRKQADLKLYECVKIKGYPVWASIIYIAVRVGGVPWLPTSWRWGFSNDFKSSWTYDKG